MAELIDKGAFLKEIESIKFLEDAKKMKVSDAEMNGFFKGMVEGTLYFVPTTTEAEIRESAIDRFLTEMLNEFDSRNADIEEHTGSYVVSRLHAVAEQLKEE